jgi:hypothetical protein
VNDSRRGLLQSLIAAPALAAAGIKNVEAKEINVPKVGRTLLVFRVTVPTTQDTFNFIVASVREQLEKAGLGDVPAIVYPSHIEVQAISLPEGE